MNCKPGDLALVVKSKAGNEGKIVRVFRFIGSVPGWNSHDYWEIDAEVQGTIGGRARIYRDAWLKPIRDPGDDARDETLTWLPVPTRESTPA